MSPRGRQAGRKYRALTQTPGLGPALTPQPCQRKRLGREAPGCRWHNATDWEETCCPRAPWGPAAQGAESGATSMDLSGCCAPLTSQACRAPPSAPATMQRGGETATSAHLPGSQTLLSDLGTMAQRHQLSPRDSRSSCSLWQCPVNWQHFCQPAILSHPVRFTLPGSSGVLTHKLLPGGGRESPTLPFTEHTLVWLGCAHNQ